MKLRSLMLCSALYIPLFLPITGMAMEKESSPKKLEPQPIFASETYRTSDVNKKPEALICITNDDVHKLQQHLIKANLTTMEPLITKAIDYLYDVQLFKNTLSRALTGLENDDTNAWIFTAAIEADISNIVDVFVNAGADLYDQMDQSPLELAINHHSRNAAGKIAAAIAKNPKHLMSWRPITGETKQTQLNDIMCINHNNEELTVETFNIQITRDDFSKLREQLENDDLYNHPQSLSIDNSSLVQIVDSCVKNPRNVLTWQIFFTAVKADILPIVEALVKAGIDLHDKTRVYPLNWAITCKSPGAARTIAQALAGDQRKIVWIPADIICEPIETDIMMGNS